MVRRLRRADFDVVGFDPDEAVRERLAEETGMAVGRTVAGLVRWLEKPRIVWMMVPSGDATERVVKELERRLEPGDLVVDGGNSNYRETMRRGAMLAQSNIGLVDVGTSGGIWGLDNGYCMMVGGERDHVAAIGDILRALAPAPDRGWAHLGVRGSGHYAKMIHNAIEYGMMQAFGEGFALLRGKREFGFDLAEVAELWRHGSVVRSWLLDLGAEVLRQDPDLAAGSPVVSDSGEGRWAAIEAIDQGIPAPVLGTALHMRFASQARDESYSNRMLSLMRHAFGGHAIPEDEAG